MSALQGGRRRQKQMGSKKELQAAIAVLGLCMLVFGCTKTAESENSKKQVKIGVAVYNEEDVYVSKICGYLEDEIFQYEKDHPGVEIRKKIADARGSQQEQNDQIDQFISLDYDLLLVNIVDRTNAAVIIDKATQADIPVVFFNREPVREDIFRSDQIYYEGSDAKQSAILQADVIADALEKDRSKIDRNGDSVIQFAMLEGESGHQDTLIRSEWVLKELENKKIPTQQIAGSTGNWEKNQANVIVRQWMKEYPNQIEVIISNNDDMALGAWEALEEKGCTEVQVVGIDGIEEVRELVDEDKILGSVLCDTKLHAKALMQFIDVLAFHNGSVEKLNLENERYYMILHLVKTEAGDGLKKGNFQTVINDPIDGNKAEGEIVFVFASSREQEVSGNLVTMTFSASEKLDLKDTGLNLKAEEWNKTSGSDINVSIKDLQYRSEVIDKIEPTPTPEKKISLNDTQIAEIEDQTYTGRAVRPGVTIQYQGKTLTEAKDYALTYKKNKKIGKASVTIKGIGEYEGSKTMTFYIAPRPPRIKKAVSDSRKKVSLRWSKKKQADGYQIKIARDKQFTRKVKTVNIKKNTKVKKTVKVKGKGRAKYYL